MKKSVWGPIIWRFLHLITLRIKDDFFVNERLQVIKLITQICQNLPCPNCSLHATQYLKSHKIQLCKTKADLQTIIFNLHNDANKRLNKEIIGFDKLNDLYSDYNFEQCALIFLRLCKEKNYVQRMMLDNLQRKRFVAEYVEYMKHNIYKYE
jgi:hypothetical protein